MVKKCLACSTETILWNNTLLNTNYCVAGAISFKLQKYFMALFKITRTVLRYFLYKNNSIMRHQNCKDGSLIKQHNIFYFNFLSESHYYKKSWNPHKKDSKNLRCIPCTCHGIFLFDLMIFTWLFIQISELLLAYLQKFLETKYIIA